MSKKICVGLAAGTAFLLYQFFSFNVLQDDAFISFRYVRNFLDGHGLVFNLGERVEGYTNFFWIMLLAFLAKLGLPLIETARAAGVLAAVGTLGLCAYASQRHYPQRNWLWILSAPFLLAANGALAYWAGSGLETALFTFLAAAGAVTYFSRPAFSLLFLALATLTRPEGALLAFLFGIAGIALKQRSWKATLTFWGGLALLLFPFAVFKWFYYGSLLPNPFYAKTGFSREYLQSGLEYVGLFLKHYGGYGLFLALPFFFWKKLATFSRFSLLIFLGYTLYLVIIGGDVLKAHRFFVPVLMFLYLPFTDALLQLFSNRWFRNFGFVAALLLPGFYGYKFSLPYLKKSAQLEEALIKKMKNAAFFFSQQETPKSLALTTIGAFSYYAGNRRVIDMLGLTEPAIARKPERIEGLVSSWKELNYNAGYVLSQKPEVILFSTGTKPSAPAERALFLYPDFRQNYRVELLYFDRRADNYYRRFQNRPAGGQPDQPALVGNLFNEAINFIVVKREPERAITVLRQLLEVGPKDCPTFFTALGYAYLLAGSSHPESTEFYLKRGMELDRGGSISRLNMGFFHLRQKQYEAASEQFAILARMVPNVEEYLRATRGFHR